MPNPVCRDRTSHYSDSPGYRSIWTYCPGCHQAHPFTIEVFEGCPNRPDGTPEPVWEWDGNMESPTFSPSMLAYYTVHLCEGEHGFVVCPNPEDCGQMGHAVLYMVDGEPQSFKVGTEPEDAERVLGHGTPHTRDPAWGNCHSFLKAGVWQFLADSAHSLAGQNVDMVPLPEWLV